MKLVCETSWVFDLGNIKNAGVLRDFLSFWTWQRQKQSNSARLPQVSKLTTSKTKQLQLCETSFRNEKLSAELTPSYQCVWCFSLHLCKALRLPPKSDARSYEVLHLSHKFIFPKLKIWCSKMQPLSGNQRPDLLTSLVNMSLVLRLPRKMHLCKSSSNAPRLPSILEMQQNPHVLLTFWQGAQSLAPATRTEIWTSKSGPNMWCFNILTWKCASRYNDVHFFDRSIPKSSRKLRCFLHFDLAMCFAPQRRALFRHLNFQKWSEHGVFCAFWLRNVLRATTAYTFSISQLPKVVWAWCVLYLLVSKCASRHNGVHFFDISTSKNAPRMVCFLHFDFDMLRATTSCNFSSLIWPDGSAPAALASMLFDPPERQIIGKNTMNRDFSNFRRTCIFFPLALSLLWSSFFFSSLLWLFPPGFSICPYCRKFDF